MSDVTTAQDIEIDTEDHQAHAALAARQERPDPGRARPEPVRDAAPVVQFTDRVIVRMSDAIDLLATAMAEAQAMDGYGDIEKSKTARVQSKKGEGSSYQYAYETLADVIDATRPFLARVGIASFQFPFPGQHAVTIRTMLVHKSGQWISNDLSALIPMPDPQAIGSGISYLRRYAMKAICMVAASDEDDDGARASLRPDEADQRRDRRPDPPAAAPRKSQNGAATQQSGATGTYERAAQAPSSVGQLADLKEGDGFVGVALATGFKAATRDPELMQALRAYNRLTPKPTLDLTCRASAPGKVPVIDSMEIVRAESSRP